MKPLLMAALMAALLFVAAQAVPPAPPPPPPAVVAFGGSGLLVTFFSGVVQSLTACNLISPGTTSLAGLSGGGFTAVATALGVPGEAQAQFYRLVLQDLLSRYPNGQGGGHLNAVMERWLNDHLPADVAKLLNRLDGGARVAVSQLNARGESLDGSAPWVIRRFESKADVVSALLASDHCPCWSGPTTYTLFRNQPVVDGYFSTTVARLCADFPHHSSSRPCLKVATTMGALADATCDVDRCSQDDCVPPVRASPLPKKLYDNNGFADAWPLRKVQLRCPPAAWGDLPPFTHTPPAGVAPGAADIAIGSRVGLFEWPPASGHTILACELRQWATRLPDGLEIAAMQALFEHGVAEGAAYCTGVPLPP